MYNDMLVKDEYLSCFSDIIYLLSFLTKNQHELSQELLYFLV